jgi:hypothetical protein
VLHVDTNTLLVHPSLAEVGIVHEIVRIFFANFRWPVRAAVGPQLVAAEDVRTSTTNNDKRDTYPRRQNQPLRRTGKIGDGAMRFSSQRTEREPGVLIIGIWRGASCGGVRGMLKSLSEEAEEPGEPKGPPKSDIGDALLSRFG